MGPPIHSVTCIYFPPHQKAIHKVFSVNIYTKKIFLNFNSLGEKKANYILFKKNIGFESVLRNMLSTKCLKIYQHDVFLFNTPISLFLLLSHICFIARFIASYM